MVKKLYLDVCALCRPYDDQSYLRINLETIAVQLIFSAIDQDMYDLVYSPVHIKEISGISNQLNDLSFITCSRKQVNSLTLIK